VNEPTKKPLPKPAVVAHADWSTNEPKKRLAVAILGEDGRYRAHATESAAPALSLLERLRDLAGDGALLVGFDFPIGLPVRYAQAIGIDTYGAFLDALDAGRFPDFFKVAEHAGELSPDRPFFPRGNLPKGQAKKAAIARMADCAAVAELMRRCERARPGRGPAECMFWTLGPKQVGKAMLAGWRDVVLPGRRAGARLWPFDGDLGELLLPGATVIAETYPAEFYDHLGVSGVSKRDPASRAARGPVLVDWARSAGVVLAPELEAQIRSGFGPLGDGEDDFDAAVGLLGMLETVLGLCDDGVPRDPVVRSIEGWIFGLR
jgi:hypothetical protein